jgi:digeranylgeranylglycerophospholipid reductase
MVKLQFGFSEKHGGDFGYMYERKTFDNEVAKLAIKEGAQLFTKTRATELIRENGGIKGVKAKIDEKEDVEIRSNIVIGADGVESHIGRWAGIYKFLPVGSTIPVVKVEGAEMDEDHRHAWFQYMGYEKIPVDIVLAVCPAEDNRFVISTQPLRPSFQQRKKGEMIEALNYFIKVHPYFKKFKIVDRGGGAVPAHPLKKFTTDHVMLAGDAAGQMCWPQYTCGSYVCDGWRYFGWRDGGRSP